ncbi:protein-glutamine gamma-glutamyltransferase E-like [Pelobates fuscus]|uniref:protein-glutamine gamma-glutamyltransferase E-like n=1 Tax=Pelobates fuscus TaxID=191477 RepID=UPI002FE4EF50
MTSLVLAQWDLQKSANASAHKTSDFITHQLVVRRGQGFNVTCTFNRAMTGDESLSFTVELGKSPSEAKNTRAVMKVSSTGNKNSWNATSSPSTDVSKTITINIPATAIIGCYRLSLQVTSAGNSTTNSLGEFYVLFNSWATEDEVYMERNEEKEEYVIEENGLIFVGSAGYYSGRQWAYGQFEEDILETTFALLDQSLDAKKDPIADLSKRNSAIYVSRELSAMVNSNNDKGVILGNWSNNYAGGVSPAEWNGSVRILRQWHSRGPVGFGQCWVYAGVLCTVLRCIGIPARVVSNFESAHDTNRNLLIDHYFDPDRNSLDSADSVWNFHVWNEGWMKRKDLGSSYNGWQILDATPQEPSKGLFRLGPSSRKAVKEGDVNLDFDTHFVYAEVNADVVNWLLKEDGSRVKIYSDSRSVGQHISTKAVGAFSRVDLTNEYKYAEDTRKEREIFEKARKIMLKMDSIPMTRNPAAGHAMGTGPVFEHAEAPLPKPDFTGSFTVSKETQVGEDINFTLTLKNTAGDSKNIKVNMTAMAIVYTRAPIKDILKDEQSVSLGPNEEKNIPLTIAYSQYRNAITVDNMIQVMAICVDDNGGQLMTSSVAILKNPPLLLKLSGDPILNTPLTVEVVFVNPLEEDVENGHVLIEGCGLVKNLLSMPVPLVKPAETSITKFDFTPYKAGLKCLMANFSSDKFSGVKAFEMITVVDAVVA